MSSISLIVRLLVVVLVVQVTFSHAVAVPPGRHLKVEGQTVTLEDASIAKEDTLSTIVSRRYMVRGLQLLGAEVRILEGTLLPIVTAARQVGLLTAEDVDSLLPLSPTINTSSEQIITHDLNMLTQRAGRLEKATELLSRVYGTNWEVVSFSRSSKTDNSQGKMMSLGLRLHRLQNQTNRLMERDNDTREKAMVMLFL